MEKERHTTKSDAPVAVGRASVLGHAVHEAESDTGYDPPTFGVTPAELGLGFN